MDFNALLAVPLDDVPRVFHQHAAWVQAYYDAITMDALAGVSLLHGRGLGEGMIALPDPRDPRAAEFIRKADYARLNPPKVWRGLDVRGRQLDEAVFGRLAVFAALQPLAQHLDQSAFDFLTCADQPAYTISLHMPANLTPDESWARLGASNADEIALSMAFRQQMVDEAAPHAFRAPLGAYVLNYVSLPRLDALLLWDSLRVVVTRDGLLYSIVHDGAFAPACWTPPGTVHSVSIYGPGRVIMWIDTLLACIWRDLCIVRERWATERRGQRGYEHRGKKPTHPSPLQFPRTVWRRDWGADDAERDIIVRRSASAHAVRGAYVRLPDGHQAHDAGERAEEFGYPAPPDGYTFRRPHTRGDGELAERTAPRIVCRGLHVASILFK